MAGQTPPADSFSTTSSTLLGRARSEDAAAWDRLVQLYSPLIFYWCRQAQLQATDAADVLQNVFHAVFCSLDRFDHGQGSFRGWLRRITLNKIHDQYRHRASFPEAEGGSSHDQWLKNVPADAEAADPDAMPAAEETSLLFRTALTVFETDFEPSTWKAFWGVTVDMRSAADMAKKLGMIANAVYLAKARVLRRLRAELRPLIDLSKVDSPT